MSFYQPRFFFTVIVRRVFPNVLRDLTKSVLRHNLTIREFGFGKLSSTTKLLNSYTVLRVSWELAVCIHGTIFSAAQHVRFVRRMLHNISTEYIKGCSRNRGSVPALSAGAYTTTLYVMVDIVKGCGRAHPTLTSLGQIFLS